MTTLEHRRARLDNERALVMKRIDQLHADAESADETREGSPFGKREEEATEAFELEKRIMLDANLKAALAEIDHAIARFKEGTYGKCESCGQDIEEERLEARPQATLCMRCKTQQPKSTGRA
ncbi:MAG: TraR/DksA C4-type zinc finger protein [Dehalococcoidia bacterium]|nr:TraR/DksA C4-type zinc finger protein [Dehalococcoidia bacterium]